MGDDNKAPAENTAGGENSRFYVAIERHQETLPNGKTIEVESATILPTPPERVPVELPVERETIQKDGKTIEMESSGVVYMVPDTIITERGTVKGSDGKDIQVESTTYLFQPHNSFAEASAHADALMEPLHGDPAAVSGAGPALDAARPAASKPAPAPAAAKPSTPSQ